MRSKIYFLLILISLVFIAIGCSSKIQKINKDAEGNVKTIEDVLDYPSKQPESPKESSATKNASTITDSLNKIPVKTEDKDASKQQPIQKSDSSIDTFEGISIDTNKYSIKIRGPGSVVQDNKIIMKGKASDDVVWNVLYTKQNIAFDKDFKISADIDLTAVVENGYATAIIGVEKLRDLASLKQPREGYCELSTGPVKGKLIRMVSSGAETLLVSQIVGKMILSYDAQRGKLTCSFDNKKIVENQLTQTGEFFLSLRSGLRSVTYGWRDEFNGVGNFTAVFDNLNVTQK